MIKVWSVVCLMMVMASAVFAEGEPISVITDMDAVRSRLQLERGKEDELRLLQFEVERLKLEVEKKKAMEELGQISSPAREGGASSVTDEPLVLRYIFIKAGHKEAVFDMNGVLRHLKEGADIGGRVIKSISLDGVSLQDKDGAESFLQPGV